MSNNKKAVDTPVMSVAKSEGDRVVGEFYNTIAEALGSKMELSPEQEKLVVDYWLFTKQSLNALEADRVDKNQNAKAPITFKNIDMNKFFLDVLHRARMGINPFINASVYCIPYWNRAKKKYDLDLRIGYKGEIASTKRLALNPIKNIRFELIYEDEELLIHQRTPQQPIEWYEIKGKDPLNPDKKIKGAVGYIEYEDRELNEVVTIHKGDIQKAKDFAQSNKFWDGHYEAMVLKTIAHRTCSRVDLDPKLVTDSVQQVMDQENPFIPAEDKQRKEELQQHYVEDVDFEDERPATFEEAEPTPPAQIPAPKQELDIDKDLEEQANVVADNSEEPLPFES